MTPRLHESLYLQRTGSGWGSWAWGSAPLRLGDSLDGAHACGAVMWCWGCGSDDPCAEVGTEAAAPGRRGGGAARKRRTASPLNPAVPKVRREPPLAPETVSHTARQCIFHLNGGMFTFMTTFYLWPRYCLSVRGEEGLL